MLNAIQFLDVVGRSGFGIENFDGDLQELMDCMQLKDSERSLLSSNDMVALGHLLNGRFQMTSYIWSPNDEPRKEDESLPEENTPDQEDEEES